MLTASFLEQLGSEILCLQNAFLGTMTLMAVSLELTEYDVMVTCTLTMRNGV